MVIHIVDVCQCLVIHTSCMLESKLVNGVSLPTSQKLVIIPKGAVYAFTPLDISEDVLPMMVKTEEVHSLRKNPALGRTSAIASMDPFC